MGAVKETIDLVVDFIIFIAACAFTISGFANTASIQNALNDSLTDKGSSMIVDAYPNTYVSGDEVIALLLLPEGVNSVIVDGNALTDNIEKGVNYIAPKATYEIQRKTAEEGIQLIITKTEGGAG